MCLEQTINRSQKSCGGIIGSTNRKKYVAQWEIIYHEMLVVSNVQREVSGAKCCHYELMENHELNYPVTNATESKICDMLSFTKSCEEPFNLSDHTELKLHNIITKEVMSDAIRKDILHIEKTGSELYTKFRKERYIDKSVRLSEPIHRNNLKTFKSIHVKEKTLAKGKKVITKDIAQAQKIIDLVQVRDYNKEELFKYDLIESSYLFDAEGLMKKPL